MHELSIAQNILDVVKQNVPEDELDKVRSIKLRIGEFAGIVVDSLEFCFEAVTADTSLEKAKLHIDNVSVKGKCKTCKKSFDIKENMFKCPYCESLNVEMSSGAELQIVEFELED